MHKIDLQWEDWEATEISLPHLSFRDIWKPFGSLLELIAYVEKVDGDAGV